MLEKIMDLQILLYSMAALGTLGAIGMLTTNLTYRRMLKSTGSKNTGTKNTQGAGSSQRISLKEKWLRLWKTRDRLLHRMNRCHLFFQDVKDRRGTSSDLSVCGRHCTGGVIAFTSGVGFFLQRRAGDGYVGRLCGADEKLDRRDSSREKSGPCFTGRNRG